MDFSFFGFWKHDTTKFGQIIALRLDKECNNVMNIDDKYWHIDEVTEEANENKIMNIGIEDI